MPSIRSILVRLVPALAVVLITGCALPSFDVTPRYASLEVEGGFGASATDVTATASLDQAGLGDSDETLGLRADLKWGMPHLVLSTQSASFSGTGTVDAMLNLGGNMIPIGATVESDMDLGITSAILLFDFFPGKTVELGLGFGAVLIDFDVEMLDTGSSLVITSNETIPIPILAANLGVRLGPFEIAALLSGLSLSYDGNGGSFIDADVFARYRFAGGKNRVRASLIAGWRQIDFDGEYDDGSDEVEADLEVSGPYFGIEFTL